MLLGKNLNHVPIKAVTCLVSTPLVKVIALLNFQCPLEPGKGFNVSATAECFPLSRNSLMLVRPCSLTKQQFSLVNRFIRLHLLFIETISITIAERVIFFANNLMRA